MRSYTPTRKTAGAKASLKKKKPHARFLVLKRRNKTFSTNQISTFVHVYEAAEVIVNSTWRRSSTKQSMRAHIIEDAQRRYERAAAYLSDQNNHLFIARAGAAS